MKFLALLILGIISVSFLIPPSSAQIESSPLDLEQLHQSGECTRKFIGGESGVTPLTIKVFYDITTNRKFEVQQTGSSFPITQQTNQVMVFYTNGTDQYQIYMEMNYNQTRDRMVYIETQSAGITTATTQEKFNTPKFCMTIFANTKEPIKPLTKEDIFGDTLNAINQVPAIITALNINTQTNSANQTVQWFIIAILFVFVLFFVLYTMTMLRGGKVKKLENEIESWWENQKDDMSKKFEKLFAVGDMADKIDSLHNDIVEIKQTLAVKPNPQQEEVEPVESIVEKIRGQTGKQLNMLYRKFLSSTHPEAKKILQMIKNEAKQQKIKSEEKPVTIDLEPRPVEQNASEQEPEEKPESKYPAHIEEIDWNLDEESPPEIIEDYKKHLLGDDEQKAETEQEEIIKEKIDESESKQIEPTGEDADIIKDVIKSMDVETHEAILESFTNESLEKTWIWLNSNFKETEENRAYATMLESELKKRGILT